MHAVERNDRRACSIATDSERGKEILDHFSEYLPKFKKIIPHDYQADVTGDCPDGRKGTEQ